MEAQQKFVTQRDAAELLKNHGRYGIVLWQSQLRNRKKPEASVIAEYGMQRAGVVGHAFSESEPVGARLILSDRTRLGAALVK